MPKGVYIRTEKMKLGLSAARRKTWANPNSKYHTEEFKESRKNFGIKNGNFGKSVSEERKLKQSITMKKLTNDPNSIYQSIEHLEKMKQIRNDPNSVYATQEYKDKISKANTGKIHSAEARERHRQAVLGDKHPMWSKHHTKESKEKLSIASSNMWKDPNAKVNTKEYRKKLSTASSREKHPMWGKHHKRESLEKLSATMKKTIQDPMSIFNTIEYKEKRNKHLSYLHKYPKKGPSKPELLIKSLLDKLNIEYKFQEYIDPYSADFLIEKNKIIIEADGTYSHGDPRKYKPTDIIQGHITAQEKWNYDLKRDNFLREKGFIIFRFWENEIKYEINLVEELIKIAIIQNT